MNPKSYKKFKDGVAEEVEVHPSVVDELISFYYSKVRDALSNLEDSRVYVEGFGTFSIRKARLEKAIIKNKSFLGNLEKQTYNGYSKSVQVKEKIRLFEEMLSKIEGTIEEKKNFKLNNT